MVSDDKRERVLDIVHELTHPPAAGEHRVGLVHRHRYRRVFDSAELTTLAQLIDTGELSIDDLPSAIGAANLIELGLVDTVRRSRRNALGAAVPKTHFILTRRGVIVAQFLNPRE